MKRKAKLIGDIRLLWRGLDEFRPNPTKDDDQTYHLKESLFSGNIDKRDVALFCFYTDIGSLQKVVDCIAPEFKVSKSTIRNEIARIRREILNNL